ncbi:PAS domain-containing sensor histidine kinase [Halovenus sp. HT40]|uniref:PAS domain-containing sensor histidine kinase n=1 Tax=Halovenus sp. HT40 TaxID=3126691 RepID=UPI00300F3040
MIVYLGEPPEQLLARSGTEVSTELPEEGEPAPECIVVDLSANSLRAVEELADTWPSTAIVALLDEDTAPDDVLDRGASDYFRRSALPDQTEVFIRRITAYGGRRASEPNEYERLTAYDEIDFFELSDSGEITAISETLAGLLDSTPEELIGAQLSDCLTAARTDPQRPERDGSLSGVGDLQSDQQSELLLETPDGETKRLQIYTVSTSEADGTIGIVHDATPYHERIEELTLYERITETVPDPLYYVDEDGIIQEVNPAMTDIYETAYEEMVGSYFGKATTEAGENKLYEAVRTLLSDKNDMETRIVEYEALSGTGETFPVAHHISVLESDGEFNGTVGMIRDITERTERQQRLTVINRLLRHNVRNQFALIIGEASTLAKDVPPEQKDRVQTILDHSWQTVDMIEKMKKAGDLLNERPHRKTVSVAEAVESAADQFAGTDAEITVSVPEDLEIYAIPGLIFALENLIENGIEHNPSDEPVVEITVTSDDEWVTIEVADNGEGIPASERNVIKSGTEDSLEHGSGIGLWVVNWIVQRSRGDITFGRSDLGGAAVQLILSKSG